MKHLLIFVFSFLVFVPSALARTGARHICKPTPILLNAVAMNGAAGTRTAVVTDLDGYDVLLITSQFTHVNNGTLTYTITGKSALAADVIPGQVDTTLTTCTVVAGTCTLNYAGVVVTPTMTGNKNFSFPIGISGETSVTVVVAHGGAPAAGDILTVTARKCVTGR